MITTEMRSHVYYAHRGARNFRMNQGFVSALSPVRFTQAAKP